MLDVIHSFGKTCVRVRDLPLLADIGINPEEVGRPQPLVVSVELTLDARPISEIGQTVDYCSVAQAAEKLAAGHIPLIETFAQKLAAECLAMGGVVSARVTVDKPFAIVRGLAGVEVEMRRGDRAWENWRVDGRQQRQGAAGAEGQGRVLEPGRAIEN
jgi:dihydroneopterin aldolase